jgi:hypothetical protein
MRTMATRLKDVGDRLHIDTARLAHVAAAYLTLSLEPTQIHVWTLLDTRDAATESELTRSELRLAKSFDSIDFDFTRIHLQGRDPRQFIPEGAYLVKSMLRSVTEHFTEAVRLAAHAGS